MGTVEFAVGYHDLFFDLMCKMLDIPRCLMFDEQGLFGTTCLFLGHFADVVRGRGDESHWGFGGHHYGFAQLGFFFLVLPIHILRFWDALRSTG